MQTRLLIDDHDLELMRQLILTLPSSYSIIDFNEKMQIASTRRTTRLWFDQEHLVAFAFVDDYNNLEFQLINGLSTKRIQDEIVIWGVECMREKNLLDGSNFALDAVITIGENWKKDLLERSGFFTNGLRSLRYRFSFKNPFKIFSLPDGFQLRPVSGEGEVDRLVALHRAAFGTQSMTVEQRLAIMRVPEYLPDLDTLAIAPNGDLAAFCIGGLDGEVGYTDPIGTHPKYQKLGLGKAIVTHVMSALKKKGISTIELGTSSDNIAMQKLAQSVGYILVSESYWYSRQV